MKIYIPIPILQLLLHISYDFKYFKQRINSDSVKSFDYDKGYWVIDADDLLLTKEQIEADIASIQDQVEMSIRVGVPEKCIVDYKDTKLTDY